MKLQNILFPPDGCSREELYIRTSAVPRGGEEPCIRTSAVPCGGDPSLIRKGVTVRTDTYMNAFDIGAWKKYTDITDLSLSWKLRGSGTLKVYWKKEGMEEACLAEMPAGSSRDVTCEGRYLLEGFGELEGGLLYIVFDAGTDSLLEAWFETAAPARREIKISLVICTYRRRKQLERLIQEIQGSGEEEDDWLYTLVIDNASEMDEQMYRGNITVYHNANTGGSGGFTRGMEETIKNLRAFPATHVLLMDDDVILQKESLYRLRALLAYMLPGYAGEAVAGRMFRLDERHVQYTAAEIWNRGDLRHIGWNCDMTLPENVAHMNDNRNAEYGGWWFCCYPMGFVRENMPLPFFLHCDDVEYGLRHGGTPIILNGIQVWHETYEYRQTPVMAYYDCRNSLFVNAMYEEPCVAAAQVRQCMDRIREIHARQEYLLEYFLLRACGDYLKGRSWFMRKDDRAIHASLIKRKKGNRYINYFRRKILEKITEAHGNNRI